MINHIEIHGRFLEACEGWHSGLGDHLYAICSTGHLRIGTTRPLGCNTDEQWYITLWRELSVDVGYAARCAASQVADFDAKGDVDDCEEDEYWTLVSDADVLAEFETWIDEVVLPRLEDEYGLEDWDAND